jgi:hypothetical protein
MDADYVLVIGMIIAWGILPLVGLVSWLVSRYRNNS